MTNAFLSIWSSIFYHFELNVLYAVLSTMMLNLLQSSKNLTLEMHPQINNTAASPTPHILEIVSLWLTVCPTTGSQSLEEGGRRKRKNEKRPSFSFFGPTHICIPSRKYILFRFPSVFHFFLGAATNFLTVGRHGNRFSGKSKSRRRRRRRTVVRSSLKWDIKNSTIHNHIQPQARKQMSEQVSL